MTQKESDSSGSRFQAAVDRLFRPEERVDDEQEQKKKNDGKKNA